MPSDAVKIICKRYLDILVKESTSPQYKGLRNVILPVEGLYGIYARSSYLKQNPMRPGPAAVFLQVEQGGPASLGGLCEGDELVSLNGQPCADLTLPEITALVDGSGGSLCLLVKRYGASDQPAPETKQDYFGERETVVKGLKSTTLEIWPAPHPDSSRELYICESQDEAYYAEAESDAETSGQASRELRLKPFTPGSIVELQLSLSDRSLDGSDTLTPPPPQSSSQAEVVHISTATHALHVPSFNPGTSSRAQVELTLQWPCKGSQGEGLLTKGPEPKSSVRGEEEGGPQEEPPTTVSLGISADEFDSEAEKDLSQPSKHRARHARFRRSESQSEKQVKEAKSKCRRIALLLTTAPNSNNKGVLMFKKHRQRAKKYTLVSYGTGEGESEDEDEGQEGKKHTLEFNHLATSESEIDEENFTNAQGPGRIVTFDWDTGLLEIEKKLEDPQEMDRLPETKGKGALMFAQRRQRMDEITAEHEEMRQRGIPVEGVQEVQSIDVVKLGPYQTEEGSYMQSVESQVYMDVNLQQHQQYEQDHYRQMQRYQDQQQYQQGQQYSPSMNGTALHQTHDMTKSTVITNRTAKPFLGVENKVATPFLSSSVTNQQQTLYSENQSSMTQSQGWSSMGFGEQIASRDERIAVPAIRTGILQDSRKKNTSKPMFTFKEPPKVSPNPELLNLLNKNEKKPGFESGTEEDYLSLGAEACNFLQAPRVKQKIPPPVAPKPAINPASPPWSPPPPSGEQVPSYSAENEVNTPASTTAAVSASSPDSAPAPILESSLSTQPHAAVVTWSPQESQGPPEQTDVPQDREHPCQLQSALATTSQSQPEPQSPMNTWNPAQPQPPPPMSTWAPAQTQVDPQPPVSSWTPSQIQAQQPVNAWMSAEAQAQVQQQPSVSECSPVHAHTQQQSFRLSPVQLQAQPKPYSHISSWPPVQQQQLHSSDSAWSQNPSQAQAQVSWASPVQLQPQGQSKPQSYVSSWPPAQTQAQTQPSWASQVQPQSQVQAQPQSHVGSWHPTQTQVPIQPSWASSPQPQVQQQPPMNTWASNQPQAHPEPSMNTWAPGQSQCQPQPSWPSQPQTQAPQQAPASSWASSHGHGQPQPPASSWDPAQAQGPPQPPWASAPQQSRSAWVPQSQAPLSSMASTQVPPTSHHPVKSWNQPQSRAISMGHPPQRRMNSYTPSSPPGSVSIAGGIGSAFEMPALRGKGAELFAKRQSRMEKFVVDSSTVQANKVRSISPTPSLPSSWKYTPNIRAPPPLSYNPIQSPSYPPGAIKQSPAYSPSVNAKSKGKDKAAPKPLHVLDVMKHQPYQLNSSLFVYGAAAEAKRPPSKPTPAPDSNNQPVRYDQFPASQSSVPMNAPYSNQPQVPTYGVPHPSSSLQEGPYQQGPATPYHPFPNSHLNQVPPNTYQQPPQPYYQPTPSPPYQLDQNLRNQQSPNPVYQQSQSPDSQPAPTPSYHLGPNPPAFQHNPSAYGAPSFQVPPKSACIAGGPVATPRPKFTANKSSAQVWKPTAAGQE